MRLPAATVIHRLSAIVCDAMWFGVLPTVLGHAYLLLREFRTHLSGSC